MAMRLLVAVLLLTVPVATGAAFFALPAPMMEDAVACGAEACFPLLLDESSVSVHGGARYAFLAVDGETLEHGSLCAPAMLQVPVGATLLVVTPGPCER